MVSAAGVICAIGEARRDDPVDRAPPRMFFTPQLDATCDDLAARVVDPERATGLPDGFPGTAPLGLPDVEEVVVVVEPDPSVVGRGGMVLIPYDAPPTFPRGEDTLLLQVGRWRAPLEELVDALDAAATEAGWPAGEVVGATEERGRLVDVSVAYDTPNGRVVREGTNCGRQGWFVWSVVTRSPSEQPPCGEPDLAARCRAAWDAASTPMSMIEASPRQLRVEADRTVVVTITIGGDRLRPAARDLVEHFGMEAWQERPPCEDEGLGFGPSPFCADPFFLDPPAGPFTWTFIPTGGDAPVVVTAAFTPRPGQDPEDPGSAGFDATITATAPAG